MSIINEGAMECIERPLKRRKIDDSDFDIQLPASPDSADSACSINDNHSEADANLQTPITPISPCREAYTRPKVYNCPYENCCKAFNRPVRLEEHIRSHTNTRSFLCPHSPCSKAFLRRTHLNHHIKSAHTNDRSFACSWPNCEKRFATGQRLRRHIAAHSGKERFRCSGFTNCSKTFRKHSTLQKHVDVEHLRRKPYRCNKIDPITGEECDHGYDTTHKLSAHIARHHSGEPQYWCSQCPSNQSVIEGSTTTVKPTGFIAYAEFQKHIRETHPPVCSSCKLACSSRRELDRHFEIAHSDATLSSRRKYPCPQPSCDKSFTKRGNLNIHLRTVHTSIKPFICGTTDLSSSKDAMIATWDASDACGASFTSKAWLQKHVRNQHLRSATDEPVKKIANDRSVLSRLTGISYSQESIATIACPLAPSCELVFEKYCDVETHAAAKHAMESVEVAEVLAEREALSGGVFWIGGRQDDENSRLQFDTSGPAQPFFVHRSEDENDLSALIDPLLQYVNIEEKDSRDED